MPSLVEAIACKYGPDDLDAQDSGIPIAIYVPKKGPRNIVPSLLVLNDCGIDSAGEERDLQKKCRAVEELDLAQNSLTHWADVIKILQQMPQVKFANLSFNDLSEELDEVLCGEDSFPLMKNLVLIATHVNWTTIKKLLKLLPNLEELHLSLNNFQCVDLGKDTSESHDKIKKLHFAGNPIESWNEVCNLGRMFPALESLVLADCPVRSLDPLALSQEKSKGDDTDESEDSCSSCEFRAMQYGRCESECESAGPKPYSAHDTFRQLKSINLNNTLMSSWDDIDRLACFPMLRCLRLSACPLFESPQEYTEHERRQLLIARLPNVQTLNGGGVISMEEREDAERAFIRYYMEKPESDRPERYGNLLGVHGRLDPLVNIDLSPEKRVKVKICYGEKSEVKNVNVYQTVGELKKTLEPFSGVPAPKMRLFYSDQDYKDRGPELMKYPNKQLYSYNIRSGDEIIVDSK